jgi:insertion element IS1 protein InsB
MLSANNQKNSAMICPECQFSNLKKNAHKRGKQNYLCKNCRRPFIDSYFLLCYPDYVKKYCLHLYLEGNGFRRIERLTGVSHNTVINCVYFAGLSLSQQPDYDEIPSVAQIDEL